MRLALCALAGWASLGTLGGGGFARSEPPAVALDHVAIYVRDADRSAAFYQEVFGLKPLAAPVPAARWLALQGGLTLHVIEGRPAPVANPKWDHIALSCPDMERMIERLEAKDVPWADIQGRPEPQVRSDGVKQIFIQDPDGYWIEINDALKPAAAAEGR